MQERTTKNYDRSLQHQKVKSQIIFCWIAFLFFTACATDNNTRPILDKDITITQLNLAVDYGGLKKSNQKFIDNTKEDFSQAINQFQKMENNIKLLAFGTILAKTKTGEEVCISLFESDSKGTIKIGIENHIYRGTLDLKKYFTETDNSTNDAD